MKILRLHGVGDLCLHDEPKPVPGSSEVLLRVTAVGLYGLADPLPLSSP